MEESQEMPPMMPMVFMEGKGREESRTNKKESRQAEKIHRLH
mgnify:CR=1 FL=1